MPFPPPASGGNVSAGAGIAVNSGTISLASVPAGDILVNTGTVSAAPSGNPLVAGANVTISGGNTISATGTLSPGGSSLVPLTGTLATSTGAFATGGDIVNFTTLGTIAAVHWPVASVVNGGSYIANVATLNASNVVQALSPSNTIVASGTLAQTLDFTLASPAVVNSGTPYAITLSRLDGGNTFVLPLVGPSNTGGTLFGLKKMDAISQQTFIAQATIAAGQTLSVAAGARTFALDLT